MKRRQAVKKLFNDPRFNSLTLAEQSIFFKLLLVAAEANGVFPADLEELCGVPALALAGVKKRTLASILKRIRKLGLTEEYKAKVKDKSGKITIKCFAYFKDWRDYEPLLEPIKLGQHMLFEHRLHKWLDEGETPRANL